ncbi:CHAD domain-containing protein [Acidocella facilis]|uniref:CHAD domain-containing protein n=1 Tax=Acidocella facilis TaxID=525 RepID=UPI001F4844EA|nr:CHAD domain-containing protein [Acidocella facilis]
MDAIVTGEALTPETPVAEAEIEQTVIRTWRFVLVPAQLKALEQSPLFGPPTRAKRLQERYLDTEDFALARAGVTLSWRKAGRGMRFSLLHEGVRLDAAQSGEDPDLSAFGPAWQASLTTLLQDAPLYEIAGATLRQTTRSFAGATLCFEAGQLSAEGGKIALAEVELCGPATALADAALALAGQAALTLQPEFPGPRAVRLAGGPMLKPQKAAGALEGAPCLDEAVHDIIKSCLNQFRANWAVFAHGDQVGAVHQMRVAMRRLRSALGLFNRALPCGEFLLLREEAKRIANAMGEARNWDVFIAMLQDGPANAFPQERGFAALAAQCRTHRAAGYDAVRALLDDPATTRFIITAEAFIARRGWRGGLPVEALAQLAAPASDFGAICLQRLHRKLRKRGRHLAALPAHDRHLVRIELKKLRYAAEFFGGLCAQKGKVRNFNRAAAALQEELGKLNDMATAEGLATRLQGGTPEALRALGIVLGWTAHAALGEPRALNAAWAEFKATKLFV